MQKFLSIANLKRSSYSNMMGVSLGLENMGDDISRFVELNRGKTIVIGLPSHSKKIQEENDIFSAMFLNIVKRKKTIWQLAICFKVDG